MKKHFGFGVAGAAFGVAIAATAYAQPPGMQTACKSTPCIYDSRGILVGMPQAIGLLWRQISGTWYQLNFMEYGLAGHGNTIFFFAGNNCTGQPYLSDDGELPHSAGYDALYYPDPSGAVINKITGVADPGDQYSSYNQALAVANQRNASRSIWAADGFMDSPWASYAYPALPANGGKCIQYGYCIPSTQTPCSMTGGPAKKIQTQSFIAPFGFTTNQ